MTLDKFIGNYPEKHLVRHGSFAYLVRKLNSAVPHSFNHHGG